LLIALGSVYAVAMVVLVTAAATGWAAVDMVSGPVMVAFGVVSVVYAVRAARHRRLDARTRRASWALTAAFVLALCTPVLFLASGPKAFPQPGDGAHMAFVLALFAALQMLPLRRATRRERLKTAFDSGTVVFGATMVLWYLVLGPAVTSGIGSLRLILAAAAYPVVDLLALFAIARALLRGTGRAARRPLTLLGGGVLSLFLGDAFLGYDQAHVSAVARTPWQFACWLTMHFLLAAGAVELWRQAARPVTAADPVRRSAATKIPYAAVGAGYLLMAMAAAHPTKPLIWAGLVVGGMGLTGQVLLRQVIAQRESAEAAETDALTGLANRARLHRTLSRAAGAGRPVAVLLVDLNGFKQVNDTLGHQAGDGLLVAVAEAMRTAVRPGDLVARLGGDEFAVVVQPVTSAADAYGLAQRIVDAVAGPFVVGDLLMTSSASIGVAVGDDDARSADVLLRRADLAMYEQKRSGGGWRPWKPELQAPDALEADLAAALDAGQFVLAFHPVVALADGAVIGADAVPIWMHPERGPIPAGVFRPIAERAGEAERLESWLLRGAVAEAARTRAPVGLEVTAQQLRRPGFAAAAARARDALVLHLPDGLPAAELAGLHALGVRLATHNLTDAYASHRFLDYLVVDDGARDPEIVDAVVRLGRTLGLTVVAGRSVEASAR
jgi:diguanylate cyclase